MNPTDGIETVGASSSFLLALEDLLAHEGGWDEILLVAGPLLIVALLLWLANRRVTAQLEQSESTEQTPSGSTGNHEN